MYSIGETAEKLRTSSHTLRYYEKEGIIVPSRNSQGARIYDDTHLQWLGFVKKLRETQMPIAQIKEYARLFTEGDHTSKARLALLEDHHHTIQMQIKNLIATEELLNKKIKSYKAFINQTLE